MLVYYKLPLHCTSLTQLRLQACHYVATIADTMGDACVRAAASYWSLQSVAEHSNLLRCIYFISLKLEVKIFATQCKHRQTADTCALTLFIRKPWCTGVSGIAHAMHTRVHCNLCCTHRRCMAHASTLHPPSNAHWQKGLVRRMDTLAIGI